MALSVDIDWQADGALCLSYRLEAPLDQLRLPQRVASGPADDLWRHTCCEAFIAAVDGPAYREFNFSPSGQWAAYAFSTYRQRNADWKAPAAPTSRLDLQDSTMILKATLPTTLLPAGRLQLALSAVLEQQDGSISYWALQHAAAQPDFHHRDSFVLPLNRP